MTFNPNHINALVSTHAVTDLLGVNRIRVNSRKCRVCCFHSDQFRLLLFSLYKIVKARYFFFTYTSNLIHLCLNVFLHSTYLYLYHVATYYIILQRIFYKTTFLTLVKPRVKQRFFVSSLF